MSSQTLLVRPSGIALRASQAKGHSGQEISLWCPCSRAGSQHSPCSHLHCPHQDCGQPNGSPGHHGHPGVCHSARAALSSPARCPAAQTDCALSGLNACHATSGQLPSLEVGIPQSSKRFTGRSICGQHITKCHAVSCNSGEGKDIQAAPALTPLKKGCWPQQYKGTSGQSLSR